MKTPMCENCKHFELINSVTGNRYGFCGDEKNRHYGMFVNIDYKCEEWEER